MALKNSQYYALMREYEQTRLKNHDLQMKRYEEVYKKLPEFKSLDESISILSVQYGKKMLNGDPKALSSLKEELAILRQNKRTFLLLPDFPKIIWNRSTIVPTAWTPDISETKNVTVSNAPLLSFYMNSPISKNFRQKHLSTILTLIFIRLPSMIKQREKTPAL